MSLHHAAPRRTQQAGRRPTPSPRAEEERPRTAPAAPTDHRGHDGHPSCITTTTTTTTRTLLAKRKITMKPTAPAVPVRRERRAKRMEDPRSSHRTRDRRRRREPCARAGGLLLPDSRAAAAAAAALLLLLLSASRASAFSGGRSPSPLLPLHAGRAETSRRVSRGSDRHHRFRCRRKRLRASALPAEDGDDATAPEHGFGFLEKAGASPAVFSSAPSSSPLLPQRQPRGKGKTDLYPADELDGLLRIHQSLSQTAFAVPPTTSSAGIPVPEPDAFSLHELVARETSGDDEEPAATRQTEPPAPTLALAPALRAALRRTAVIATDVDGTLLTSSASSSAPPALHPRTRRALHRALDAVRDPGHPLRHLVLATGKTRVGALLSLRRADPVLGDALAEVPGVFVQGLYCVDGGGGGGGGLDGARQPRVVWDRRLDKEPVLAAERLADDRPWLRTATTLFGYRGDDIYYLSGWSQPRHVAELHGAWGEPEPIPAESFESLMSHPSPDSGGGGGGEAGADGSRRPLLFHKLLLMDSDAARLASRVRPEVEAVAARHGCAVTQAVPTMVELLPPRSSKEEGVRELCRSLLGEHYSEGQGGGEKGGCPAVDGLVAIGDAENDVGMLGAAAVGFAVGNAVPAARDAADVVLGETNDEGGAGAAIEMVLDLLDANAETAE